VSEPTEENIDGEKVVEQLSFEVERELLSAWIAREARAWDAFLSGQPGFLGKEVWVEEERADGTAATVHVVVWWASQSQWKAVPAHGLRRAEAAMGDLNRPSTGRAHRAVRAVGGPVAGSGPPPRTHRAPASK
jgi:uncharacterized protein (TIGR03792 family)